MALTYTPTGELGSPCPDFSAKSVDGKKFSLSDFKSSRLLLFMFICNHCPYVKAVEDRLLQLAREYRAGDIQFVAVCSNDPSDHPEDRPEELLKRWREKNYGFPYLIDEDQSMARDFGAVCTPDFFLFDQDRKLRYRGRLDDSWRNPTNVRKRELKEAIEQMLQGHSVSGEQNPSMGCSIKWKA